MKYFFNCLLFALILGAAGCAEENTVPARPEAVVVERTEAPYPNAIWIDNEYRWDNGTYIVVPAHWEKAQGVWVPGHWKSTTRGYSWVPGHWE